MSYMYGLEHANKDFEEEESFGKNTFTTAFPISLMNYMDSEKDLMLNYIIAKLDDDGVPTSEQVMKPLKDLIGIDPKKAFYAFEDSFNGYDQYAVEHANRSDVVVKNAKTGEEVSAFEVKLVVAPTSGTAKRKREKQLCELVVRPPSIEQLCFSVAASFGKQDQLLIRDIIVKALKNPMDYDWNNKTFIIKHREQILEAAEELIRAGLDRQRPLVIMGEWRTIGQGIDFDDDCFDCFFWSNFAFLQLFTGSVRNILASNSKSKKNSVGRPERALIWFIKSMFDYTAQGQVMFERTHSLVTFGGQTDKAGSFTNNNIAKFVLSDNFVYPRVKSWEYEQIITMDGVALLKPERRLDAVLIHLMRFK